MSSTTLSLTGNSSLLHACFHPEIELNDHYEYSCSLLDFYTYNSIPNVHENNNKFQFAMDENGPLTEISIPVGSYEASEIIELLENKLKNMMLGFRLKANPNTMKCYIYSNVFIDFSTSNSIGSVLGFHKRILAPVVEHESDHVVNIQAVNNIRIDCDLITGSYHNGHSTHTIYEFSPTAAPGYKINEQPKHLIYLPVIKRRINEVNISILDQDGNVIDFRGEKISCRIHIKRGP